MTLKAVVESLEGVPEPARPLYAEKDGKFHLQVEGLVPKARVDEFRDNNLALKRQIDELTARFDGIDPEVARKLAAEQAKLRDKQLIEAGKVDELLAERTGKMKNDFEAALKTERETAQTLKTQLESLLIDGAIRDAATKAGVRATAVDDVLLRGRQTFRVVDGKAVPMEGDKPIFGRAGEVMDVQEWVMGLTERAPHLFEPSQGAGARGAPGAGGNTRLISAGDNSAFIANLDAIAGRKVNVA